MNAKKVYDLYSGIDSEVIFTDPVSSQLIKYLSNAYLPLRLSFVNEASQIIKELGGDLTQTLQGIGLDKRIGLDYFRPSPGWGGSCFPKDVKAFISTADKFNVNLSIVSAVHKSNKNRIEKIANKIINNTKKNVGIVYFYETD